jgi:hypothetical protein
MMPPIKITSITITNIKKVLSMVTPFVRTRHATKWWTTHTPQEMRPIDILSLDKAETNNITGSDAKRQLGPTALWEPTFATNLILKKWAVK